MTEETPINETPINETPIDEETFLLTEITHHKQEGRPDVYVGGKGQRIPMQVAINLGLIKGKKAAAKAMTPADVENEGIKPAVKSSRKSAASKG